MAGAKTCEEFKQEFGSDHIKYIHCDVTDKGSFESKFCSHHVKVGHCKLFTAFVLASHYCITFTHLPLEDEKLFFGVFWHL